jgi:hypothetical protein
MNDLHSGKRLAEKADGIEAGFPGEPHAAFQRFLSKKPMPE